MFESNYIGEHTLYGQAGHILVIITFTVALVSFFSYFKSLTAKEQPVAQNWLNLGRLSFYGHSVTLLLSVLLLFYMIASHLFEYNYVWKYSNMQMEAKYIFSCFWSGQQGSFMLWAFWGMVLGNLLIKRSKEWEAGVMMVFALVQAFIYSMLLGVYFGEFRIGDSPFLLIRQLPENINMPWTQMTDYLSRISEFEDGTGLNPLLQNYWMTIHPPTLFLGFASTLVPFAFAFTGIIKKDFYGWVKPALPWTYFSVMILGVGILMGGAWAYEALSFGGFWAWDPVENASFVPWLTLVGGAHVMLVTKNSKRSAYSAMLLIMLSFILVLFSTFLTRSGILGESSVHSFTGSGMLTQLLFYLLFFFCMMVAALLLNKQLRQLYISISLLCYTLGFMDIIPLSWILTAFSVTTITLMIWAYQKFFPKTEEEAWLSKEFWMLLGALVLGLSAIQITCSTSIPLVNKVFDTSFDAFTDLQKRNEFYNTWQTPFAIIVAFLLGVSQFLNYKNTNWKMLLRKMFFPVILASILTLLVNLSPEFKNVDFIYWLLVFASSFVISSNFSYFIKILKGNINKAGSVIAHIGFGMILLGVVISTAGSIEISENSSGIDVSLLNEDFDNHENILLTKGDTLKMENYFVTYRGKYQKGVNLFYEVGYYDVLWNEAEETYKVGDSLFTLYPFVQLNEKFGNVPEPGTKHFLKKDIFTHIKWADLSMNPTNTNPIDDDYMGESEVTLRLNEKFKHENLIGHFTNIRIIESPVEKMEMGLNEGDIVVQTTFEISEVSTPSQIHTVKPLFIIRNESEILAPSTHLENLDIKFRILRLENQENTLTLGLMEREYIVMEAIVFPYINILWTGCIIMALGCIIAIRSRVKQF